MIPLTNGRKRTRAASVRPDEVVLSGSLPLDLVRDEIRGVKVSTRPTYPIVLQRQTSTAGECSQALAFSGHCHCSARLPGRRGGRKVRQVAPRPGAPRRRILNIRNQYILYCKRTVTLFDSQYDRPNRGRRPPQAGPGRLCKFIKMKNMIKYHMPRRGMEHF